MAVPWRGLAASAVLHGALVAALVLEWPDRTEPENLPAEDAVTVSFAVPPGAPDTPAQPDPSPVEQVEEVETTEETDIIEPEETTAVEPEPEAQPEPEPLPPAPVAPPEVATLPPPETIEAAEPKPAEPATKKPVEAAQQIPPPVEKTQAAATSALPPEGAEPSPATTAPSSREPDYPNILLAWLQQKLIYPPKAERRGIEGTATVWLSIDPTGRVLEYRILQSSGHRILDREVEALIERADPMPPVPPGEQAASLEFTIPVVFDIQ